MNEINCKIKENMVEYAMCRDIINVQNIVHVF